VSKLTGVHWTHQAAKGAPVDLDTIFQGTAIVSLAITLTQTVTTLWRYHVLLKIIDRWGELTDRVLAAGSPPPDPAILESIVRNGLRWPSR
jgi:hypothetical protein